jgi:flagellar hook-length control protein FliK
MNTELLNMLRTEQTPATKDMPAASRRQTSDLLKEEGYGFEALMRGPRPSTQGRENPTPESPLERTDAPDSPERENINASQGQVKQESTRAGEHPPTEETQTKEAASDDTPDPNEPRPSAGDTSEAYDSAEAETAQPAPIPQAEAATAAAALPVTAPQTPEQGTGVPEDSAKARDAAHQANQKGRAIALNAGAGRNPGEGAASRNPSADAPSTTAASPKAQTGPRAADLKNTQPQAQAGTAQADPRPEAQAGASSPPNSEANRTDGARSTPPETPQVDPGRTDEAKPGQRLEPLDSAQQIEIRPKDVKSGAVGVKAALHSPAEDAAAHSAASAETSTGPVRPVAGSPPLAQQAPRQAQPVAEPARAEPQPAHTLDQDHLMSNILRQAKMIRRPDGGSEMSLRLQPEDMGSVLVKLTMQNDQLSARLQVDSALVREAVDNLMTRVRESLADEGIDLDSFSVGVRQEGQPGPGQGRSEEETGFFESDAPATDEAANRPQRLRPAAPLPADAGRMNFIA